jgi:uncharacterized repeat protein (TIGR01451 family)
VHAESEKVRFTPSPVGIFLGALMIIGAIVLFTAPVAAADADLSLSKSDSPDPVAAGAELVYSIGIANAGPDIAGDVVVRDNLPKGVKVVSAVSSQGTCSVEGRRVTCSVGTIVPSSWPTYAPPPQITIRVLAPDKAGTITNTASVSSDQKDPSAANNTASTTTRVTARPPRPKAPKGATCGGKRATHVGTVGPDVLTGSSGRDVIVARAGNDRIRSFGGRDLICAGRGNDVVKSGSRADRVFAGPGADRLFGQAGSDVLRGGRGRDLIRGGRGADLMVGGRGFDRCFGGPGLDSSRSC